MKYPEQREIETWSGRRKVWLVDEGDVWQVWCMDCGYRIGTVNAGNDRDAYRLLTDHDRTMHL